MVVVVIVCVSFLLMMIVLGVVRIHRTQRHGNNNRGGASGVACDEKNEMEWDNSALTITVNPMDQEVLQLSSVFRLGNSNIRMKQSGFLSKK